MVREEVEVAGYGFGGCGSAVDGGGAVEVGLGHGFGVHVVKDHGVDIEGPGYKEDSDQRVEEKADPRTKKRFGARRLRLVV